jgi:menaquinone-dependent protoporphyrinogen IX oxidase
MQRGFHLKAIVLFASKSGNTRKLAQEIAAQLGCEAVQIIGSRAAVDLELYDLVFLGTGLYAGTPNEDVQYYLQNLKLKSQKQFALFITWGGAPNSDRMAISKIKQFLQNKGQTMLDDVYKSFGGWKFVLMKRGHPTNEEIVGAGEWAKNVVANMNGKQ